jgi:hypothetical protein
MFIGIFLTCSGVGAAIGIVLLMAYFWSDIKKTMIEKDNSTFDQEEFEINSMSEHLRENMR